MATPACLDAFKDEFKSIDYRSKDCINGYVRECAQSLFPSNDNNYVVIPKLIIRWILLYYYERDSFDRNNYSELCYTISDDNYVITRKPIGYNQDILDGSAYLSKTVTQGVHRWKFKLRNVFDNGWMVIGIWKINRPLVTNEPLWQNAVGGNCYGWIVNYRRKIYGDKSEWYSYGKKECVTGDIVEMILDLNKMKLNYFRNGEDYGRAYKNIEKTGYKAVISMNQTDCIEIISG